MQSDRQNERGVKETRSHRLKWKLMDEEMSNNSEQQQALEKDSRCVNQIETEAKLS